MHKYFYSLLILLVGGMLSVHAQAIRLQGEIEDVFLKIALPEATITVMRADSTVVADSVPVTRVIGRNGQVLKAVYSAEVEAVRGTYLVRATLRGYSDSWQKVTIKDPTVKSMEVPALGMRKSRETQLGEATVTATRIKMYYKGDTLVYNADAFKLPDGSMLDGLIRQLPGVTLNDGGEIYVNGRKVDELLLGSRSFMRGNKQVLMENLPYYTVNDLKVYEKQTAKSEALGYDVEPRKFVMDVNLKKEYNRGYIANVEAAGGTQERWLGRAFVLGFTNNLRLSFMANANNVNETRHIGQSGHWTPAFMPSSMMTTRSVKGEADYENKRKKFSDTFYADFTSTTNRTQMRRRYEQFLEGSTPTSVTQSYNRHGNDRWSLHNAFELKAPFYFSTEADFKYIKRDGASHSVFDQWEESPTASNRSVGMSSGTEMNGMIQVSGALNIGKSKQHINVGALVGYQDEKKETAARYDTKLFRTPSEEVRYNSGDYSRQSIAGLFSIGYSSRLFNDFQWSVYEEVQPGRSTVHDYLYHPDTLSLPSQLEALTAITDIGNSYYSQSKHVTSTTTLSVAKKSSYMIGSFYNIIYDRWRIDVKLPVSHRSLDYRRGALDTLARQNDIFVNVSSAYRQKFGGRNHEFSVSIDHKRQSIDLSDRVTYRDDSAPLVVKLGNPDLKSKMYTNLSVVYYNREGKNQQQYNLRATLDYRHRDVAQSVSYAPQTGVYTYKPMNVKGAYTLSGKGDYSRALDKRQRWSLQVNIGADYLHSVDHSMFAGESESHVNVVNTLYLSGGGYIQYNKDALNVRLTGDVSRRHSEGEMRDFSTLRATDFKYGFAARYTLPRIKTTLAVDGHMYSRRGYGSETLNADDFVLNASISQSFLKGKLVAMVNGYDLLHQVSSTQYAVNAQGRTETWFRSLPRYVMLHLIYHWNKSPKKR